MKNKNIHRFLFLIICVITQLLIMKTVSAQTKEYLSTDMYKLAVEKLSKIGVVSSKDYLKPNSYVTRQEFVRAIAKISNVDEKILVQQPFSYCIDVKSNTELCGYVNWAVKNKYLNISIDGKFRPFEEITFSHVVTAMVKNAKLY